MKTFNLDVSLINFGGEGALALPWTARNAVEGVQIFGGIGSGKSSGSGRMLALRYLQAGFGGLVLTAKPDELKLWKEYCKLAGRENDLLIVGPSHKNYFDFLAYVSSNGEPTENIVQVLKTVIRASQDKSGGASDDPFWETALDMLISNVIDICKLAYGSVSVEVMYDIVQTLPKPETDQSLLLESTLFKAFREAKQKLSRKIEEEGLYKWGEILADMRCLRYVDQFFFQTYKNLSEKTRSIIDFSFSGFLFQLLREPVYSLFCNNASTVTPEDSMKGKIILLDLPVKTYHKVGRDCQILFKYIWQRTMEKRDVEVEPLPVFLWADEAQNFLHEGDVECQATARSSRIATVYISQNLPNYLANMGTSKPEARVHSLLGTLATKIFHCNVDIDTNKYASELIGDVPFTELSTSNNFSNGLNFGESRALRFDRAWRPEDFTNLRTGSAKNGFKSEAVIHVQGTPDQKGKIYRNTLFNQLLTN